MTGHTSGWIGVDLDGTLAHDAPDFDPGVIGAPVPHMVERIRRHLEQGDDVRIVTARVADDTADRATVVAAIMRWCQEHLGRALPVTNAKDYGLALLYDDRAESVVRNTGLLVREQLEAARRRYLAAEAAVDHDRLAAAFVRALAGEPCELRRGIPSPHDGCDCHPCRARAVLDGPAQAAA